MEISKIETEKKVMTKMIQIYCRGQGHGEHLCEECKKLIDYANHKLDLCKFGENKTFCSKCKIHCYNPQMRQHIKMVMRYSGPRMLFYNPIMAIKHLLQK